jgi:hypothetical protein
MPQKVTPGRCQPGPCAGAGRIDDALMALEDLWI